MLENVFIDNVFDRNQIKIGDRLSLLCEYCVDAGVYKLLPLAEYIESESLIGGLLRANKINTDNVQDNTPIFGIWEIEGTVHKKDATKTYLKSRFRWTIPLYEVHSVSESFDTMLDFVDYLQSVGIPSSQFDSYSQDFFLKPNNIIDANNVNSLQLKKSDFYKQTSFFKLNKSLLKLTGFNLQKGKNYEEYTDSVGRFISFYKFTKITEKGEIVKTQSEEKIRLKAITKYLDDIYKNKNKNTATKNYVNAFSEFLRDFTSQKISLIDLESKTGLSQEKLLNKIGEIKSFLEKEQLTFDERLIKKIVENNENIRKDFLSIVEKNYEEELKVYKDDIQKEASFLKVKQEEKSKLEQEILEIEERKSSLIQFADSFTSSFENKLNDLKKSVPEALSSVMFNRSILGASIQTNSVHTKSVSNFNIIDDSYSINENELEKIESIEDLLDSADDRLDFLNVKTEYRKILIATLYTCDKFHCNLILCGKLSEQIAQTYSFFVYGSKAAVLDCSQDYEPTIFSKIESLKAKVVVVRNPFEANWIDKLASISASSEKFFILTHPFIEDLIIEPKSVYSYFIPLFTNELIDFSKSLDCSFSSEDIEIPSIVKLGKDPFVEKQESSGDSPLSLSKNSELKTVLRYLPSEISNRYKLLNKKVELITNAKNSNSFISMFIVPYLFATGKIDEKNLDDIKENEDASNYLKELLGSDND